MIFSKKSPQVPEDLPFPDRPLKRFFQNQNVRRPGNLLEKSFPQIGVKIQPPPRCYLSVGRRIPFSLFPVDTGVMEMTILPTSN